MHRNPQCNRVLISLICAVAHLALAPSLATADTNESGVAAESETGTLVVQMTDLKTGDGKLRMVMFDSKEDFLKRPLHAEVIGIENLQGTWTIEQLPYGTYAVLAHQDVNENGKMERHWYGKPKEPTGTSNDAPAKFGPPKFKDAEFQFETETLTIEIAVK